MLRMWKRGDESELYGMHGRTERESRKVDEENVIYTYGHTQTYIYSYSRENRKPI